MILRKLARVPLHLWRRYVGVRFVRRRLLLAELLDELLLVLVAHFELQLRKRLLARRQAERHQEEVRELQERAHTLGLPNYVQISPRILPVALAASAVSIEATRAIFYGESA